MSYISFRFYTLHYCSFFVGKTSSNITNCLTFFAYHFSNAHIYMVYIFYSFFCDIFTNQLMYLLKSFIKHHVDAFQFDMSCGD